MIIANPIYDTVFKRLMENKRIASIFEQQYFVDEKNTIKEYEYPVDDDNVKTIVEILKYAAADAKTRREMEEAWWADQNEKEYERMEKDLAEKNKLIAEKDQSLAEKDQSLAEKEREIAEKDRVIAELKRLYENKQ